MSEIEPFPPELAVGSATKELYSVFSNKGAIQFVIAG
jgi:hypothetical protein